MVDLHPTTPGLPEGHRWLALSRWSIALRALLAVGVAAVPVLTALNLFVPWTFEGASPSAGLVMGLRMALITGATASALAAVFGPRLRRYAPLTQAVLFGGLTVAGLFVIALVVGIVQDLGQTCDVDTLCTPQTVALPSYYALLFGFPVFLAAALGYGFAIWATERFAARRAAVPR